MWAAVKNTNSISDRPSIARCDLEQRAAHLNKLDEIVMHLEELASDETQNSLGNICSALLEADGELMGRYLQMNSYVQCLG